MASGTRVGRFCSRRFLLGAVGIAACGPGADSNFGNPTVFADTTGTHYDLVCASPDQCELSPETDVSVTCGGQTATELMTVFGHFLRIAPASNANGFLASSPDLFRIVVCSQASDCPRGVGITFACEHGLCQRHDAAMLYDDVLALCLASTPTSIQCTDPAVSAAVAHAEMEVTAACPGGFGQPCTNVPADCRMP
jgi:hypothetical protein